MWIGGLLLLTWWTIFAATGAIGAGLVTPLPDQRLWSEKRVRAWRDTLYQPGFAVSSMCPTARFNVQSSVPSSTATSMPIRGILSTASGGEPGLSLIHI